MDQDPLQYIKNIQAISWKDLGYSELMSRELPGQERRSFLDGADMDGYYEDGGFQGAKLQSISAVKIITSELVAALSVGNATPQTYLKIDGPNQRFVQVVNGLAQIVIGELG